MKRSLLKGLVPLFFAMPLAATANDGELWEISSQMNIPGMPAGMGAQTQRICQGDDPERAARERKDQEDCKVKDRKQTATRTTMTLVCKQGTMTIDQQYNAARTEFKGTMRMNTREGEFTMNTTGRKVGACDVKQARKEREDKNQQLQADMKRQQDAANKMMADQKKAMSEGFAKSCAEAVETMDARRLEAMQSSQNAQAMPPEARSACEARRKDFCAKLQTHDGYSRAARVTSGGAENGANLCRLDAQKVKASLCASGTKAEAYRFLGANCPAEAKPIFAKHCAGRDYTSMQDKKTRDMCQALARVDDGDGASAAAPKPASTTERAVDRAEKGISEGINRLKGLFGR